MNTRKETAEKVNPVKNYSVNLSVFNNCVKMFDSIGAQWARFLKLKSNSRKPFAIALSGGRAAADLFKSLVYQTLCLVSDSPKNADFLKNAHFFWADERCVPPDSLDSNFMTANHYLLQPLKIKTSNIHRIRGELKPEQAAKIAEQELIKAGLPLKNGLPVIDLVILGMGEDGHTASLFPEELKNRSDVIESKEIYRAVIATKPPPHRVTLGYKPIINAKKVWVVISGKNKQTALANSLPPYCNTPLGVIIKNRKKTEIFYHQEN